MATRTTNQAGTVSWTDTRYRVRVQRVRLPAGHRRITPSKFRRQSQKGSAIHEGKRSFLQKKTVPNHDDGFQTRIARVSESGKKFGVDGFEPTLGV